MPSVVLWGTKEAYDAIHAIPTPVCPNLAGGLRHTLATVNKPSSYSAVYQARISFQVHDAIEE